MQSRSIVNFASLTCAAVSGMACLRPGYADTIRVALK